MTGTISTAHNAWQLQIQIKQRKRRKKLWCVIVLLKRTYTKKREITLSTGFDDSLLHLHFEHFFLRVFINYLL